MLIPNISFKVSVKKLTLISDIITKITVLFGRLSKFRNGPNIVSSRPITLDTKNLGKRNTFSQKSGILDTCFYKLQYILSWKTLIFLKYFELKLLNSQYIVHILLELHF